MAINVDKLCADFEALVGKAPYPESGSGSTNYNSIMNGAAVDCSGLFVACFAKEGGKIPHGSNTIWRQYLTENKGVIEDSTATNGIYSKSDRHLKSTQLKKGMAVFKWNSNTPSKFKDGLGDYQHIGIITSAKPLRIVHSTSENKKGVTVDTKIGKWCAWGQLKGVSYTTTTNTTVTEQGESTMAYGQGVTNTTVNFRAGASTNSDKIGSLKNGTKVNLIKLSNGWWNVNYNGKNGYVKANYITVKSKPTAGASVSDVPSGGEYTGEIDLNNLSDTVIDLLEKVDDLEMRITALEDAIDSAG